jgi:hypothetical protein
MDSLGAYGSDSEEEKEEEEEGAAAAPPPAFSIPGGDSEVRKLSHTGFSPATTAFTHLFLGRGFRGLQLADKRPGSKLDWGARCDVM